MMKNKLDKEMTTKKTKKKLKAKKFTGTGLRIVDEDSFNFGPPPDSEGEDVEDLPQIAEVVDDRPVEVQLLESFNQSKWKRLQEDSPKAVGRGAGRISDDDLSPPRGSNSRKAKDSDNDLSPPRRTTGRRRREGSDNDDLSPPRRKERRFSPLRKPIGGRRPKGSDSDDLSPPRRRERGASSPQRAGENRRRRGSVNDDMSPPRRRETDKGRKRDDLSPPRRQVGNRSRIRSSPESDDLSPPRLNDAGRRGKGRIPERDLSPPRREDSRKRDDIRRKEAQRRQGRDDLSPSRRPSHSRRRSSSPEVSSHRDIRRRESNDFSPPRKRDRPVDRRPENKRVDRSLARPEILEDDDRKAKITLDGKKAGLQKAGALREEMVEFRQREMELFETLPDELSGRNAKAVVRDRRTEADKAKELEKQKNEAERKEQYSKWGKGIKQVEEQESRVRSALHEMSKPLARYQDDEDLDEHLKQIDREGDPMLEYLTAKRRKAKGGPEKPKYTGPQPPPNRFNIPPGYRWDGVDRSNGYEKEWFGRINARKAVQEEAYKWSVEDL